MNEEMVKTNEKKTVVPVATKKREFDPLDNKYRGYRYIWEVYPEHWTSTWGNKPLLGYVRADSEFNSYYAAFDKGLNLQSGYPFGIETIKATKFVRNM